MRLRTFIVFLPLFVVPALHAADAPPLAGDVSPRMARESVSLETDSGVMKQFEAARNSIASEQWSQAVEMLDQIVVTNGEVLNPITPGRYVNSQLYAKLLLAGLPAEGRAAYRKTVDPQARQWLTAAQQDRDESQLRKIVDYAFNSSYGDDALLQLGEREWERGEIDLARAHWLQILPPDADTTPGQPLATLQYPDSDLNLADVAARLVLCSLAAGDSAQTSRQLKAFRQIYPEAKGSLGGRKGNLAEIVSTIAAEAAHWPVVPDDVDVATFAVNSQRNALLPHAVDVGAVQWTRTLPSLNLSAPAASPALGSSSPLSYHPATFGDIVLVNSNDSVFAWNVTTGKPAWPAGENDSGLIYPAAGPPQELLPFGPVVGVPHATASISEGRLYARMGTPITETSSVEELRALPSHLICLDLMHGEGKLVWKVPASTVGPGWTFAGSPLVENGRLYVALRQGRPQTELLVACYDVETGDLIWTRSVCGAIAQVEQTNSVIHNHLLSLGQETLFLSTDLGAIAALDTRNGTLRWVVTYQSRAADSTAGRKRNDQAPTPCVYYRGLVIAAPHDGDSVIALDASTGVVVWERQLLGAVDHLLGVAAENLVVSGHRLWGIDAYSGSIRWTIGSGDPATFGYGRGLLAGDSAYWPKRDEIFVVDYRTGQIIRRIPLTQLHGVSGGNLLIAKGMLLVAEPDRLVAFGSDSRLKSPPREKISANGE